MLVLIQYLIPYRERGLETFADQLLIYFTQRDILLAFVDVVQSQFPELDWHALANNYVLSGTTGLLALSQLMDDTYIYDLVVAVQSGFSPD